MNLDNVHAGHLCQSVCPVGQVPPFSGHRQDSGGSVATGGLCGHITAMEEQ